ncbi:hypothetical protein ES703_42321 [subsurface metagenome]
MNSDNRIKGVDIHLQGFTREEFRDMIGYIRSVEAERTSRIVFVNFEVPDDNVGEALKRWARTDGGHS